MAKGQALTPEREGEIARALLKEIWRKEGARTFDPSAFRRTLGSLSQKIGIPADELRLFATSLLQELVAELDESADN
ncbi:MAG: hypothetical protein COU11_00410 [Candidatus Harrisonbacteria bacterium CG10_big_fil_rev_8_21_14_0_10_49_15]|uniref:Uncharacterized protein n=1 Tax=Candidatus Harrisonbacteria bacterium CG10_big_fil_rev_8_21_14_0_10_49_15 TaxID=1974587 RepID=A0A2H0UP85_9BACT|nr:MAG: hypothetical protein COU11_00410 [Candidatus Harrisonbacteria bacterium CG10_big_fil_rev_8_21_14_0_10_49_15]